MTTTEKDPLRPRPRPEREWHVEIRDRNEEIRGALRAWLHDGNNRKLRSRLRLVSAPAFGVAPSPHLRTETEALFAMALRALLVAPAPRGGLQEQRLFREAAIGRVS